MPLLLTPSPPAGRGRLFSLPPFAGGGLGRGVFLAAILTLNLTAAVLINMPCLGEESGFWDSSRLCDSDISRLYEARGLDQDRFPYRPAGPPSPTFQPAFEPDPGVLEYPAGIGLPLYAIALITEGILPFYLLNALTLAAAGLLTLGLLALALGSRDRSAVRLLGYAAAPTVAFLGLQNWDFWVLPAVVGGLLAASRHRPHLAAALFGLGAAIKLWPALLVPLVMVGPWAPTGTRWRKLTPSASAAAVWAAIQLPVIAISAEGWWGTYAFHLRRRPNPDSFVGAVGDQFLLPLSMELRHLWFGRGGDVLLGILFLIGLVWVLRRLARGVTPPPEAALGLLLVFLITSNGLSPQAYLWVIPLAVLTRVRWTPVLAVELVNLAVWILIARFYGTAQEGFKTASQLLAVLRTVGFAWLIYLLMTKPTPPPNRLPATGDEMVRGDLGLGPGRS